MSADDPTSGAEDYESLPYVSMPYAQTQPSRLAAIAALHGMAPPAVESAHVLELGCASGGNLIPLAARFPRARFLGLDLGRKHVEDAAAQIRELALSNIEIRQTDIGEFRPTEKFDYIICHGVFSWTPRAIQDAVLRICREALSDSGVALVSFNVLPGWRMRSVVRDLCLRHSAAEASPSRRVAKARALLDDIAAMSSASDPFGLLVRNEAQRIAHRPASYIMGEFMSAENAAFFFSEFAERAAQSGLAYLSDADLDAAAPETLKPPFQERLAAYAGDDMAAREQYADYFTGRPFRSALLVKAEASRSGFNSSHIRRLQISGELAPIADAEGTAASFQDARGRAIRGRDPVVVRALGRLAAAQPATLSLAELLGEGEGEGGDRLCEALGLLLRVGQITAWSTPLRVGRDDAPHPRAWELARKQAASGQPFATSLAHAPVLVKPITGWMLKRLDGRTDRAALEAALTEALRRGEVRVPELVQEDGADLESVASAYVRRALHYLASKALLTA